MGLEEVVKAGRNCLEVEDIAQSFGSPKGQTDYNLLERYAALRKLPAGGYGNGSPASVKKEMDLASQSFASEAATLMKRDYEALISTLDEEQLFFMALGVSGRLEMMSQLGKALNDKDIDRAREIYAHTFQKPEDQYYVQHLAREQELMQVVPRFIEIQKEDMAAEIGNKDGKLEKENIISYIGRTLAELGEEKASAGYFYMAKALAQQQLQKEEEKKAKEKKDKKKK